MKKNEIVTENIFRRFHKNANFLERTQIPDKYGFRSKNNIVNKGYPDFLLDLPDFVIVVEAKADDHNQAISDIKHYLNFNSINKDIIGIAVSGQSKNNLKLDYFIKHHDFFDKNNNEIIEFEKLRNSLLSVNELKEEFFKNKYGSSEDEDFINILNEINNDFHKLIKIREGSDRSLLFSGLMIALSSDNFRKTYLMIEEPSEEECSTINGIIPSCYHLTKSILSSIDLQLSNKANNLSKQFSWVSRFSFINTIDYPLEDYKKLIKKISDKIYFPYKVNENKLDLLGRAYKTFLSRSGSKAENKNIILTPDHIKSLMIKLANLDCDDVVLDTCTGTGGFLMESMENMINKANSNQKIIEKIKSNQLIGFESDDLLFSLACTNMFLHGDGRTNLLHRSSLINEFDSKDLVLLDYIKKKKVTKCIINPPYEDASPFDFTEQAIDFLKKDGELIVIIPSITFTKNAKRSKELFEKATLNYEIKMPSNLFSEQKRTIQTSIFSFTKRKHNFDKPIYYYNLADDGFVSIQNKGKVDINKKWNEIEQNLLKCVNSYKIIKNTSRTFFASINENDELYISNGSRELNNGITVGDLFDIHKNTIQSSKSVKGNYNFISGSEEWKTHNKAEYIDTEALIYVNGSSGSLGRCHYVNGNFTASSLCLTLTLKEEYKNKLSLKYYSVYFNKNKEVINDLIGKGASKRTVSEKSLSKLEIPLITLKDNKEEIEKVEGYFDQLQLIKRLEKNIKNKINDISL